MPLQVLPDALIVTQEAMLAQTTITASAVGTRIHWGIPETTAYPIWVLSLVDDIELRPETLSVRVQVDVWGDGSTAQDLADAKASAGILRAAARDLNGDWAAGKIRNCVAGLMRPSPDPKSARVRFIVDLTFELNQ
jgi:hypothetical protein